MKMFRRFGAGKRRALFSAMGRRQGARKGLGAKALLLGAALTAIQLPQTTQAAQSQSAITIRNDSGGSLQLRINEINRLRQSGTQVRIVGDYCNSACTMYLGLPNTCVSRSVTFGFHGPMSQFYGVALAPDEFEYWSGIMASYYPQAVRSWYMHDARYTLVGLRSVSGSELIRLGVPECR